MEHCQECTHLWGLSLGETEIWDLVAVSCTGSVAGVAEVIALARSLRF